MEYFPPSIIGRFRLSAMVGIVRTLSEPREDERVLTYWREHRQNRACSLSATSDSPTDHYKNVSLTGGDDIIQLLDILFFTPCESRSNPGDIKRIIGW